MESLGTCVRAYIGLAGAWEALFVYDSMIFGLTLYKSWSTRGEYIPTRGPQRRRHPTLLLHVIVRDGALFLLFFVLCVCGASSWPFWRLFFLF